MTSVDREKAVSLLRRLGFITVARIQRVLGFSYNRAVKIVAELVDEDVIRPDDDLSFRYRAVDRVENEVKKGQ